MEKIKKFHISFNAPGVLIFVGLCLLATVLGMISGGVITQKFFMTYHSSLLNPLTYLRLFTHVFGHSGWSHFVSNMAFILLLGPLLEEKYGAKFLWKVIAVTAVTTGIVSYIAFPNIALCGASGVVFAFILLASFTNFSEGEIPLTFILVAAIYLGEQIITGLTVQDDIANFAHIIGGIIGMLYGYWANKRSAGKEKGSPIRNL